MCFACLYEHMGDEEEEGSLGWFGWVCLFDPLCVCMYGYVPLCPLCPIMYQFVSMWVGMYEMSEFP